jgi:exportin-1
MNGGNGNSTTSSSGGTDFAQTVNLMMASVTAQTFDIAALDRVVATAYSPSDPHRAAANKALMQLQEVSELWTKADAIIEGATNAQARFFGLQALDDAIKTRWKILPAERGGD